MASVQDVAAYVLQRRGPMTAMKLQKLCYYAHAWNLVWDEQPLFEARIEAWANGPVICDLFRSHRGKFSVDAGDIDGDPERLSDAEVETIDAVLRFYADLPAHTLSELTHQEDPWRRAREHANLAPMERGNVEITDEAIARYYDSITAADAAGREAVT